MKRLFRLPSLIKRSPIYRVAFLRFLSLFPFTLFLLLFSAAVFYKLGLIDESREVSLWLISNFLILMLTFIWGVTVIRRTDLKLIRAQESLAKDYERLERAQEALLHAKDYLEKIINAVADPIFVKDREHRWALLNDAMCALFGRSRDELIGKSDYDFFPKNEADVFWAKDEEVFQSGLENLNEESFTDASGTRHIILTKKTLYKDPSGKLFIVGVIRDITLQKKMEEDLKKNFVEIEVKNQELKDFAHVVSHDLKAPTYAVSQLADWLWEDYGSKLDPKGVEQIELIRKKMEEVRCLINGILAYSMQERLEEKTACVDLNGLLQGVLGLIQIPPSIKIEIPESLPEVLCEETRMKQIFQNLIDNAVKYMDKPEGCVSIGWRDLNQAWEFSVADNGPGIEPRNQEKIFQLFQAYGGKARYQSAGIGLAIVRKAVEYHGGRIWVESVQGQGSIFRFTLPKNFSRKS